MSRPETASLTPSTKAERRRVNPIIAFIGLAAAIGLSQWSILVPRIPVDGVAVFWCANALTAAAFLVYGPTRWGGVLFVAAAHLAGTLGRFAMEDAFQPLSGYAYTAIDIFEPYAVAWATGRFGDRQGRVTTPRTVAVFVAAAVIAPAISGVFPALYDGTLGPGFFGDEAGSFQVWSGWWLGNATGYAVIMPAAVLFMICVRLRAAFGDWLQPTVLAALTTALIVGADSLANAMDQAVVGAVFHRSGVIFVMTPIFAFAAFRYGVLGAALTLPATYLPSIFILADPSHALHGEKSYAAVDLQIGTLETVFTILLLAAFVENLRRTGGQLNARARQLATAQREAQEASRTKSKFLMAMSHEMRTPLHQIVMASDVLRDLVRSDGQSFLTDIRLAAKRLLAVMDDVLDFARSSDALERESAELVILDVFLDQVADGLRPSAEDKGLTLRVEVEPCVRVRVESGRVRKALNHLLDNAVRHTEEGEIILRGLLRPPTADESRARLRLEVADTGPGVPDSERERIFEPFTQVSEGEARVHQGLGVGLAVARAMARLVGGEVGVEAGLPSGSVFWVEIPVEETSQGEGDD